MFHESRLENRLDHQLDRHLHYPVRQRRYARRSLATVALGYPYPPHPLGSVGLVEQLPLQALHEGDHPFSSLHGLEGQPVNAGRPSVGPSPCPGMAEDVQPGHFVVERVEAAGRCLLGLGIKLPLQCPDREWG